MYLFYSFMKYNVIWHSIERMIWIKRRVSLVGQDLPDFQVPSSFPSIVSEVRVLFIMIIRFSDWFWNCFLLFLVCHFINVFNNSSVSPGCIVWNILFSKCKLYKNTNLYHVTFKEEFKDTKGVIRIRKSKKGQTIQCQKKKDKQRSTKHTHKTKDRVTRTPLNTWGELRCSWMEFLNYLL